MIPTEISSPYPYSATGEFTNQGTGERNEQLIELAFVAARTAKLRLVKQGCKIVKDEPDFPRCYIKDPFGLIYKLSLKQGCRRSRTSALMDKR